MTKAAPWIALGVGAVAVAGAGLWWRVRVPEPVAPLAVVAPQPASAPAPVEVAAAQGPVLDVLRVDPAGQGLIAGHVSEPGRVAVHLAGQFLAQAAPETDGRFVMFVTVPPSDVPRRLLLSQQDGALAGDSAMIAPFAAQVAASPQDQPVAITSDAGLVAQVAASAGAGSADLAQEPSGASGPAASQPTVVAAQSPAGAEAVAPSASSVLTSSGSEGPDASTTPVSHVAGTAPEAPSVAPAPAAETASASSDQAPSSAKPAVAGPANGAMSRAAVASTDPATPPPAPGSVAPTPAPTAPATPTAPVQGPGAPVLVAGADGVRVMPAADAAPALLQNVSLDLISYTQAGDVALAGAGAHQSLRIYLDNRPVTEAPARQGGTWQVTLPDVDEGVYTLRVDSLDAKGTVISRVETPFRKESPAHVAQLMAAQTAQDGFDVAVRTVQPGNTLWAIAKETYGEGILYVRVFRANADLIRDPDLIYPGQVFRLPQEDSADAG